MIAGWFRPLAHAPLESENQSNPHGSELIGNAHLDCSRPAGSAFTALSGGRFLDSYTRCKATFTPALLLVSASPDRLCKYATLRYCSIGMDCSAFRKNSQDSVRRNSGSTQ